MVQKRRILQTFLAGVVCALVSWASAVYGSASGYEVSIYSSVTPLFWILIAAAFALFTFGIIEAANGGSRPLIGANLFGITLVNGLLTALPALRYKTYYTQWDVWFHLSNASNIVSTGHIDLATNFYPPIHLLWSFLSEVGGYSVYGTGIYLGSVLAALSVPLTYVVASRLFRSPMIGSISASLAAIPLSVVGTFPSPWFYSLTTLLAVLLVATLQAERPTVPRTVCGIVTVTALVISHPIAPVFLLLAILLSSFSAKLVPTLKPETRDHGANLASLLWRDLFAYVLIIYISWISLLTLVLRLSISQLLDAISAEGVVKPISYGKFFTIPLLAKIFGATLIVAGYWLGGLVILRRTRKTDLIRPAVNLIVSMTISGAILAIFFEGIAAGLFLGNFVDRPLNIIALLLPPVAAVFIADHRTTAKTENRRRALVIMAISVPFLLALPSMLPSPYVALFNYQNTQQLYTSAGWAADHIPDRQTVYSNSHFGRYAYFPLHTGQANFSKLYNFQNTIPLNLTHLLESSTNTSYLVLDKETIMVASMDLRAWSAPSTRDVEMLNSVDSVFRIYDSGEVQVYEIDG